MAALEGGHSAIREPAGFLATDFEQVSAWLAGQPVDPPAVADAARSLQGRLQRLKDERSLLKNVELSSHVLDLLK